MPMQGSHLDLLMPLFQETSQISTSPVVVMIDKYEGFLLQLVQKSMYLLWDFAIATIKNRLLSIDLFNNLILPTDDQKPFKEVAKHPSWYFMMLDRKTGRNQKLLIN